MQSLDLKQKIGQMLMFGWQGETEQENLTVSEHARVLVEEFQVGGIALLGRNISTPEQVAETINELQRRSNIPLIISVDQEGGMVARLKHPFSVFPGNMGLGATRSADLCKRAARATARELTAVGINMNFAPCVDVNINPENPIIGVRSYGESPELVATLGTAAIDGYQSMGIIACAKHFPGHGDTCVDTHYALPVIRYGRDRLDSVELLPFRAAVEAGVASIMTTHITFTALDDELPATLSEKIITGLLRGELGYDGLVVADCLEMKAIADTYGAMNAGVLAVKAGVDILLAGHTLSFQRELRDGLMRAVETGVIPESRIDESVERILAVKERFRLESRREIDIAKLKATLADPEIDRLEREIAEKAVTLVRNEDHLLPLKLAESDRLAVMGMHPATEVFAQAIRAHHANTDHLRISKSPTPEELARADEMVKSSKAVILTTCPLEPWTHGLVNEEAQVKFVNQILDSATPAIIIAAREPYGLRHFPKARTCIATYGYPHVAVEAAADLIFGLVKPSGCLPVSVPEYAQYGAGIQGF